MRHLARALKDKLGFGRSEPRTIEEHLEAAAEWILRAQQATADDGVAHSYDLRLDKWLPSYPETTGYIIPTLYDYAAHFTKPRYKEAARRMAEWEVAVQQPDGGVRAGTMDSEPVVSTVFNTGQGLFGFARAARETGDERIHAALIRAADWLVAAQDEDGCWRRFFSPFSETKTAIYNTRSAFGLVRAFEVTGDEKYLDAAHRNVRWALSRASPNGWLPGNSLAEEKDDSALMHTLAYSIRGILEVGVATAEARYLDHALKMAKAVAGIQNADGSLPAYCTPDWRAKCRWSCVTGNSQMAINSQRLAREAASPELIANAVAANRFNMSVQDLNASDPNVRGALKGSHPFDGGYMTWRYPNWAAKFFMDALMLEKLRGEIANIG